ncbi:glycoside hydrolase family 76 protein [Aspergillus affinis]|uniref:glycoside hydrolase family 76 protein n=1 Tax=Aspergillus affinis TaxID=1070780 RepID=UPI0022FE41F6|nr:mannan endo-1 [Aspergillus affinis]KAI9037709.1 mannan endo-1 [Aspergillus affinis]
MILLGAQMVQASISLDLENQESIRKAAKTAASGMLQYYTGYKPGDVPGNLPDPYYWWETGAMFNAMVEYWYYTGDSQWNDITTQALLHQVGPENNYMEPNQTRTLGNDDQAFWGLAAMAAAEVKFPNPPKDKPQWLALAQAVFNTQYPRWDNKSCNGGLKWQVFSFNNGYNYKNTVSNGCFFNLAARLAVYTGNKMYAEWAEKTWDWVYDVGLISNTWEFYDGTDDNHNCTDLNHIRWTYNAGLFLLGAAHMYHFTDRSDIWKTRVENIIRGLNIFFPTGNIMSEVACEPNGKCNVDQRSFKAYLSRWMSHTIQIAPFTKDLLMPKLRASAEAAALQCSGPNNACGLRWNHNETFDGSTGVGEQMAALEIFQGHLVDYVDKRVTANTGGISEGDPDAGTGKSDEDSVGIHERVISTGDRVGAGILTAVIVIMAMSAVYFMAV